MQQKSRHPFFVWFYIGFGITCLCHNSADTCKYKYASTHLHEDCHSNDHSCAVANAPTYENAEFGCYTAYG